nr:MAG TPA: hypothetical protein [Caudoviricetes sp.]
MPYEDSVKGCRLSRNFCMIRISNNLKNSTPRTRFML